MIAILLLAAAASAVPPDPHHHVVDVHARPWSVEVAPDAKVVATKETVAGNDSVLAPGGALRAFIVENDAARGDEVQIEETRGPRRWRLRGLPLEYRPLSDLAWIDDRYLAVDRWSQPHYGMHYLVDMKARRLVLAAGFPDTLEAAANSDSTR